MPILPFQPDVLKHVVQRVTVGSRYQIDTEACVILNARLAGVDGNVTVTVYTDRDADYVSDNPETADSEEGLIALAANTGTSDSQNPMAPPTHADYGLFCKAEGTATKQALLELTYVHRCDYERSFEPIKVETVQGQYEALDTILSLPAVPPWSEDVTTDDDGGEIPVEGVQDASGSIAPIGETVDDPDGPGLPPDDPTNIFGSIELNSFASNIIEGASDTFKVSLNSDVAPQSNVVVSVTSSNASEASVSPSTLTFTPSNYGTQQTVTVTAANDADVETYETVKITMAISTGDEANYTSERVSDEVYTVTVIDTDTDSAGVTVSANNFTVVEGDTAKVHHIVLNAQPSANVTVDIGNLFGDGEWEVGISSSYAATKTLTFTNANWNTPQDFQIRAVNDSVSEVTNPYTGAFAYTVTASSDSDYAALIGQRVILPVLVYDNDASNFASGTFTLQAEHKDAEGYVQLITTESGNALIRTE